ncbi:MAG TPA: arginine repressor [Acidimicrobiia bacterium]|nr:arginine repressor [Acidimicrobiia bacterium]
MATSSARRRIIRSLLTDREVASQNDIVALLASQGFDVTQATVSRDLASIGAHKDGDHYVLGPGPNHDGGELALAGIIDAFVTSIEPSGNLVVLKTPPGAAQVVAAALDRVSYTEMAGCVAGDDTVLVVVSERAAGREFAERLQQLGANL